VPGGPTAAPMMSPLLTPFMFASFTPQEASRYYLLFVYFFESDPADKNFGGNNPIPGRPLSPAIKERTNGLLG
jgi:hypothetical protein